MTAEKKPGGKWAPGQSGNPAGSKGRSAGIVAMRERIAEHVPSIIDALVSAAKAGDVQAARCLLERAVPAYRSEAPVVVVPGVAEAATLTDKGRAVLDAAAGGEVSPTTAGELLGGLAGVARLVEIDQQQRELDELARRLGVEDLT